MISTRCHQLRMARMLFDRSHFESRHSSWTVLNGPEPRRLGPDRPQTSLEAKDINDADVAAEAEAGRSREKPCCRAVTFRFFTPGKLEPQNPQMFILFMPSWI